jgi:endonuclease III
MSLPAAANIAAVDAALRKRYGRPDPGRRRPAVDVLIETVLSQNTSDTNSHRAFLGLKRGFPRWERVMSAPAARVARAIRTGGLANIKARRIKRLLAAVANAGGKPDLSFLKGMGREQAYQHLLRLDGVGPKTAACTLLFGAGIPVFPVDTHIIRIAKRLGWAGAADGPARFQERFRMTVPDPIVHSLHINLIEHGRAACHPRTPRCPDCCIQRYCKWYNRRGRT